MWKKIKLLEYHSDLLTMTTPWFYSALYNGSFMLIDMVLVLVIGALLWKPLRKYITGEDLHGAANAKNEG